MREMRNWGLATFIVLALWTAFFLLDNVLFPKPNEPPDAFGIDPFFPIGIVLLIWTAVFGLAVAIRLLFAAVKVAKKVARNSN